MAYFIRELRMKTGLTQKAFADLFDIPVSTLRKWEQGEASPAPYVVNLLARALPGFNPSLRKIEGEDGAKYWYDEMTGTVSDTRGNTIPVAEDLNKVKEPNLKLYISDLFARYYEIQEKFNRDCRFDMAEDVIWTR